MGIIANSSALLRWPQQQHVPLGGSFNVYGDGRSGTVDYARALNARPLPAWPDGEGKIGLALGGLGNGGLGWGDGGAGLGMGALGLGLLGFGAALIEWRTEPLADGTHTFGVVGLDVAGNKGQPGLGLGLGLGLGRLGYGVGIPAEIELSVALAGTPGRPTNLAATAYKSGTDTLTLGWTLSADDEG